MQRSYSVEAARSKLAEILDDVEAGEDIEIVRRGKRIAVILSTKRFARLTGERVSFGDAYDVFSKKRRSKGFGFEADELEASRDRSPGRVVKR